MSEVPSPQPETEPLFSAEVLQMPTSLRPFLDDGLSDEQITTLLKAGLSHSSIAKESTPESRVDLILRKLFTALAIIDPTSLSEKADSDNSANHVATVIAMQELDEAEKDMERDRIELDRTSLMDKYRTWADEVAVLAETNIARASRQLRDEYRTKFPSEIATVQRTLLYMMHSAMLRPE